ncbi:MAG: hypothetical protein COA88_12805 [Kordia sp.]|jgi:hypothetical protein|nr:MAG: hypothetical protein COA88_12805 [Kordia sp.]
MPTPNPKYDDQSTYNKHQGDCGDGDCGSSDDCGCCPPGLVAVYDCKGTHAGCLTPNDAAVYNNSLETCAEGFLKFFHPITGEYMGCATPEEISTLSAQLDPAVSPVPTPATQVQFNLLRSVEALGGASGVGLSLPMTIDVDRVNTSDPLVIQMATVVNPPAAGITLVSNPVVIAASESTKDIQIAVAASVVAGAYVFNLEIVGAGITKTVTVTLTLT